MKLRMALFATGILSLGCLSTSVGQQAEPRLPDELKVTLDTQQTAEPVTKYIFGMFIEHIGPLIYHSLWAEMLDDRKFYFPITSKEPEATPRTTSSGRNIQLQRWLPVGPDAAVVMDKEHPFVGDQSPRIELDSATPHGIRQSGLSLVKGKKYVGRVYLRGTPGSKVKVSLIWGDGAGDRQTVSINSLTGEYKKFPLNFGANADTTSAALEITGTGSGNFHVGAASLMPTDNVEGFRPDTIALLRQIHSGTWRLPGGNFLSNWNWYDGIGDIDKRPPMFDYAWNAMQVNDVGMDEFMTLCKLIDVEPYITVNAGLGDAHSAAEEVEYINGPATSYMGAKRAKNGHPEPYRVHIWNIGNEPWGTFQIGYTDLKYYVIKNNDFAKAMRQVDPSIMLIGSAKMLEPTFLKGDMRAKHVDDIQPLYGSEVDWTGGLLAHSWGTFDGIAEHWYESGGRHFDVVKAKSLPLDAATDTAFVKDDVTTLEFARHAGDVVLRKAEEWEGYQQRFPQMVEKKIFLSIDEYAYSGASRGAPTLKLTLAYGMLLNEMLRHTDFLKMGAHTMGVSTIDYNRTASTLNTNGLLFKLYSNHFPGTIPVAVSGNSPQPAPKFPGGDSPKVTSGSPTYPLDVFAALEPDKKSLLVSVVNATESVQKLDMNLSGMRLAGPATQWQLTGNDLDATDRVGQPPQVEVKETSISDTSGKISVAPNSVNLYRFPVGAAQ